MLDCHDLQKTGDEPSILERVSGRALIIILFFFSTVNILILTLETTSNLAPWQAAFVLHKSCNVAFMHRPKRHDKAIDAKALTAYSRNRTGKGQIMTEIVVHCLLQWLSGGSYLDVCISARISKVLFILVCINALILYCLVRLWGNICLPQHMTLKKVQMISRTRVQRG